MPTIDATIGGVSANSYVTLAEANAYFDSSYNRTAWTALVPVDATKSILLVEATRLIDTYFVFNGLPTSVDQALQWPRVDALDVNRETIADDVLPNELKNAVCEMAYHLLSNGGLTLNEIEFTKIKVSSIQLDFNTLTSSSGFPKNVKLMLSAFGSTTIVGASGITQARLVRT